MKKLAVAFALVSLLALGGQAFAVICTIDQVPAATLLLPYFEVDLSGTNGQTTLFSINNSSATAVLAHVVIWSDLSVPVLDFNVYLTGYDVQTINLRDIIQNGVLPRTASAGQDPGDTISPKGSFSQDINFASCSGQLPLAPLGPDYIAHLQSSLTGHASAILGGDCAGQNLGDNIARGYVTVDTVSSCTLEFPGDLGYFGAGGTGFATNQNVLWGDYFLINSAQNFASGDTLVHIEASATNPETSVAGQYTFYGRYVNWTAADNREPLATNFAARFINGGPFSGGTSFLCWRDSKVNQQPFTCPAVQGVRPAWYPLADNSVIFDEQEHPQVPTGSPVSPPPPSTTNTLCPAEAQRTIIGGDTYPVPYSFGWIYANLNTTVPAAGAVPPEDPAAAQGWISVELEANGRYSVGYNAVQLDSACTALHFCPGGGVACSAP
jgi:hypothetical protein